MLRSMFTDKWILGSIALLIIIACGCYVWYQYTTAQYEKQYDEMAEFVRQLESQKAKQNTGVSETKITKSPAESNTPTAGKPTNTEQSAIAVSTSDVETDENQESMSQEEIIDKEYEEYLSDWESSLTNVSPKVRESIIKYAPPKSKSEFRKEFLYYNSLTRAEAETEMGARQKAFLEFDKKAKEEIRRLRNE